MKQKILSVIVTIFMVCFILSPVQVIASSYVEEEYSLGTDYAAAQFSPGFGEATILLKKGFDFINTGSSTVNWDLALTGVTLSDRVYNGKSAEELLKELGYDKTKTTAPLGSESNSIFYPVSSMGYKHIIDKEGNEKNVFAVVVRGTSNLSVDWFTDLCDGAVSMFDTSRGNVAADLREFIKEATGKSIDALKHEDNYFYICGHSLGGAVANALSVDDTVTSLCNGNKEHIYTYTFESPHTCVNLWWMPVESMSNAYNIKDVDDAITNIAPYIGATTYGKDMIFSVNDLDNDIFVKVFPNANGKSVTEAPRPQNHGDVFGHHDLGLCLVYIMQHGIADGWWDHVHKIDNYISMWTEDEIMESKSNTDWSLNYFTLGGVKVSIELPSNWNSRKVESSAGEDIEFYVTETDERDYTVCSLRCMNITEYERVKSWYEKWGSSFEDAAEYYGKKGEYHYAMVWLDGYGYSSSTQLIIDNALKISRDVAKTFQFCE